VGHPATLATLPCRAGHPKSPKPAALENTKKNWLYCSFMTLATLPCRAGFSKSRKPAALENTIKQLIFTQYF